MSAVNQDSYVTPLGGGHCFQVDTSTSRYGSRTARQIGVKHYTWLVSGFLALLIPVTAPARSPSVDAPNSAEALALAQYLASIQARDPFTESGPVAVVIEAWLPRLHKESRLVAIRNTSESEHSEYRIVNCEGDAAVLTEVIAPYLTAEEEMEKLPAASVMITPANYKFRYIGVAPEEGATAYAFQIAPKETRDGLLRGELWIDGATGTALVQAGSFVKLPSRVIKRMDVVRHTQLADDGSVVGRITRIAIEMRRLGRAYLTAIEIRPSEAAETEPSQPSLAVRVP